MTILDGALALLDLGLWPIPIHAPGSEIATRGGPKVAVGKEPIGLEWGKHRHTPESLRDFFRRYPEAGVGIKLGRDGGVIDVEVEDRATGLDSFARLMGGEVVETRGWDSSRGPHALFRFDDRLVRYGKRVLKNIPGLPGIEVRIGALASDEKQFQSVCPPSPTTEGWPRRWNGVDRIAELPESFFAALDPIYLRTARPVGPARRPARDAGDDRRRHYALAALDREADDVASTPEGDRNDRLNLAAFNLGQFVEAGHLTPDEIESALTDSGRTAGLGEGEIRATIRSGLGAGRGHPRDLSEIGAGKICPTNLTKSTNSIGRNGDKFVEIVKFVGEETSDEPELPIVYREWPYPPDDQAYYGLAGQIVRAIDPHTEADSTALLVQILVLFGNLIGRTAHFRVEATTHHLNLFATLVGLTSRGRKGTSFDHVRRLAESVDAEWAAAHIVTGLSSGEGLIWQVRDPVTKREAIKEKGRVVDYQEVEEDPGVSDKRLVVVEPEFASTLRVMTREGNTLSSRVREAWDSGRLSSMTKNFPARATGAHISIIGHITRDELERSLTATDAANGFANRFLWICSRRSKLLPFGGRLSTVDFAPAVRRLGEATTFARQVGELARDEDADRIWERSYAELSQDKPGLLGAVVARSEAQVMRLACLYALLDRSAAIRPDHLAAAMSLWDYAERSARYVFGDAMGDPDADRLLTAIRSAPLGLSRASITTDVFQKNRSRAEIARILGRLLGYGLVRREMEDHGAKRPVEVWYPTNLTKSTNLTGT
jgi:hypothetical protein